MNLAGIRQCHNDGIYSVTAHSLCSIFKCSLLCRVLPFLVLLKGRLIRFGMSYEPVKVHTASLSWVGLPNSCLTGPYSNGRFGGLSISPCTPKRSLSGLVIILRRKLPNDLLHGER